ncbi:hypothetical protein ABMA27_000790 [Loxostege sticticalis]|uniref:SCP domain-containing protein n=1 Tax=Loxostege sticticalis TaxID=481309 RepID=A0ABR3I0I7_LOXSC
MAGPSSSCKEYDENPLTKDDFKNIVDKINEGRNFVASGLSRLLPQAANMNKIYWSDELAAFAQRWVDQCDSSTRPDKEDECRDLEDSPVGQNIVSILGPSPGMHLTSLIDVWFMQKRDYKGSVAYYNQSRDWKTNHFTQLIWAETDRIGCGRARFYVDQKESIIERLVCNFAPRGNINGKPVYAIGYPATQCQKNKAPDSQYKSLCAHWIPDPARPLTTSYPPVSSLLRILNLSNNSVKLDIDPIRNNLKQANLSGNGTIGQRNQKTRHVFFNGTHASLRNMPQLPFQNQWHTTANPYSPNPRAQRLQHYQAERGHSRVYHGHDLHDSNFASTYKSQPTENYRKFDYNTEQISASADLRKHNRYNQCTRRPWTEKADYEPSRQPNQCTRRHATTSCAQSVPLSTSCPIMTVKLGLPMCQCNTPRPTCATMPPKCPCNINCQCFNSGPNIQCLSARRTGNNDDVSALSVAQPGLRQETRQTTELHYYDLLPNMAFRSGDEEKEKIPIVDTSTPTDTWLQHESTMPDIFKRLSHKIRHDQRQRKKKA